MGFSDAASLGFSGDGFWDSIMIFGGDSVVILPWDSMVTFLWDSAVMAFGIQW